MGKWRGRDVGEKKKNFLAKKFIVFDNFTCSKQIKEWNDAKLLKLNWLYHSPFSYLLLSTGKSLNKIFSSALYSSQRSLIGVKLKRNYSPSVLGL